jgi:hypothetical protein
MKELTSLNKKIDGLNVLGFKSSSNNKVQIDIEAKKIKIRVSFDGTPFVEVINVEDNSIPYGQLGVGTYGVKALFNSLEMFPHIIPISEGEISKILSTDINDLYMPESLDKKNHDNGNNYQHDKSHSNNNSDGQNKNGNENSSEIKGLLSKDNGLIGMNSCLSINTTATRQSYCRRVFPIIDAQKKCQVI